MIVRIVAMSMLSSVKMPMKSLRLTDFRAMSSIPSSVPSSLCLALSGSTHRMRYNASAWISSSSSTDFISFLYLGSSELSPSVARAKASLLNAPWSI